MPLEPDELVKPNAGAMNDNDEDDKGSETEENESAVKVPESFQKASDALVYSATKPQLEYLRSCIMDREKTLMHSESKPEKAGDFDMEGMPE